MDCTQIPNNSYDLASKQNSCDTLTFYFQFTIGKVCMHTDIGKDSLFNDMLGINVVLLDGESLLAGMSIDSHGIIVNFKPTSPYLSLIFVSDPITYGNLRILVGW